MSLSPFPSFVFQRCGHGRAENNRKIIFPLEIENFPNFSSFAQKWGMVSLGRTAIKAGDDGAQEERAKGSGEITIEDEGRGSPPFGLALARDLLDPQPVPPPPPPRHRPQPVSLPLLSTLPVLRIVVRVRRRQVGVMKREQGTG